jgi:hypothetical protein
MYDVPDHGEIRKCLITEETIREGRPPLLLTKSQVDEGVDETNYEEFLAERGQPRARGGGAMRDVAGPLLSGRWLWSTYRP